MEREYSQAEIDRTQQAVTVISNFVNSYGHNSDLFNKLMANEHRTLQQSFTKLVLKWLEFAASPEYRTDRRNEATKQTAQKLLEGWELLGKKDPMQTADMKPSTWLPLI